MLWLAGLMGIAGAGAASFVSTDSDADDDMAETADDFFDHDEALRLHGDLLDGLDAEETGGPETAFTFPFDAPDAFPMEFDGPLRHDDPHFGEGAQEDYARGIADPEGADFADDGLTAADPGDAFADPSRLLLGDWIATGPEDEVFDYHAETERLVLIWDDMDSGAAEPDLRVEQDPFDAEVMHILMNGKSVAEIYGDPDLTAADVTMIPLSSALIVGLEPA